MRTVLFLSQNKKTTKFADNTTATGLKPNNSQSVHRDEVKICLVLNKEKTKEMMVDIETC